MVSRHEKVLEVIEKELAKPYKEGSADCFILGLRVDQALTKSGKIKKYLGKYRSENGAKRLMVNLGCKNLSDVLNLDFETKAPAMLTFGDLAVVESDGIEHIAVCFGGHFISKTEAGKAIYTLSDVKNGFGI